MTDRLHFIGVGGSGMSAVARLTAATGVDVSGTDAKESAYFLALKAAGMDVRIGHDASLVEGAAAVVISTAVRESNVELAHARELGIPVLHRSEALARALEGQRLVSVAGSHGKTTTSALTAHLLHACGVDASYAVGARVLGIEGAVAGGYAGTSGVAVVEADESDGSFLRYDTEVAIILNIEPDHLDFHGTVEALHAAFEAFARGAELLVACVDDPVVRRIATRLRAEGRRVVGYGVAADADVRVTPEGLVRDGEVFEITPSLPGAHQRLNAAAAWAAAVHIGADAVRAARAVATFGGTGRRFELRGEVGGIRVIDDYAHHPTEVAAMLAGARASGAGHLIVLFQPALFTRTQLHAAAFGRALSVPDADVILAEVHGDREDPIPGVTSQLIADAATMPEGSSLRLVPDLADAAAEVARIARPGDLVLTVGSGPVTQAAGWVLGALRDGAGGAEHA
ncbi:UDP-N-acetylmuramate--L-alanine ligase [Demequina capsici]|uniref:UDP-N-acetylmuramate--L-alanine ligase n=1 Tax=Demequina capsici TaxID=3075620 RepID=A0AA96F3L7_9MICO|nr:UDP-N-acetylmuramate--L-alanine ligase [Demequina sp. OYTSA14]WNM23346.1 UDP-N-acetylmuramate--L-alanine ligase [Demequina sp. OYTSA14]